MHIALGENTMMNTFTSLKEKEVININSGKRLGYVSDLDINIKCGDIITLIVTPCGKGLNFFSGKSCIYIPWQCIEKIGKDTILVRHTENPPVKK